MKNKKRNVAIIVCVALLITLIAVIALADESDVKDVSGPKVLTAEEEKQLEALRQKGKEHCGTYLYQEKVLLGEIIKMNKRMTLADAEKIVADSENVEIARKQIEKLQPVPDFAGGSGVSNTEYWLDDEGNEMIVFIREQGEIYYCNEMTKETKKLK